MARFNIKADIEFSIDLGLDGSILDEDAIVTVLSRLNDQENISLLIKQHNFKVDDITVRSVSEE